MARMSRLEWLMKSLRFSPRVQRVKTPATGRPKNKYAYVVATDDGGDGRTYQTRQIEAFTRSEARSIIKKEHKLKTTAGMILLNV